MKRLHLFEFEDFPWFPGIIREGMTDYLRFVTNLFKAYKPLKSIFVKGLSKAETADVIDLCSGGGGAIEGLAHELTAERVKLKIILTDKYPNIPAFERIRAASGGVIDYIAEPVDAMNVLPALKGFRTIFTALHHFKPEDAKRVLKNAAELKEPVAVFEFTERSVPGVISMLFSPLFVFIFTPFIRPFKLRRLFLTYIIPAIPLFTLWDGIVSALRTYTPGELKQMGEELNIPGYKWESGKAKGKGPAGVIYLLGYPDKA